jgi:hypothetical protein
MNSATPALHRGPDKVAAHFLKHAGGRYAQNLLRQRMAPLGVTHTCGGTCTGGGCEEHQLPGGASSAVYHGFVTSR